MTENVVRLHRPPVRQQTVVRSDLEHTFDVFVRTIGAWWPSRISSGADRMRDVTLEPQVGGRVYETWQDGTVTEWGEITAWSPPAGFTMAWRVTPEPTEVELTFTALGPALTRVAVEHRGWEALSEVQAGQDCALPGGYHGGAYNEGWRIILTAFATSAGAA